MSRHTDIAGMSPQDYAELLDTLRKDLQLDAATDLLPGSIETRLKNDLVWQPVPLSTGAGTGNWGTPGGGLSIAQYAVDGMGLCHLRGAVSNASLVNYSPPTNLLIGTLPPGARPTRPVLFHSLTSDTAAPSDRIVQGVLIFTTGAIQLEAIDYGFGSATPGNNGAYAYVNLDQCPPFSTVS